jgi:hypothetical protein
MMQGSEPVILLFYIYVCVYYMCINSWCSSIFPELYNAYIPWEGGVLGLLSEFRDVLRNTVNGWLRLLQNYNSLIAR